jgi:hypothetical protein
MNNWALDNTFLINLVHHMLNLMIKQIDISGYVILRNDMILYNGVSLNNKLTQLQSQYDLISISGLLNSILYLNSVDAYFNYYVTTLSGQISSINNSLSTYSNTSNLMNNVTYLNYYVTSLSEIDNTNYLLNN